MDQGNIFYVYVADHPATGRPVYVGKGKGRRKDRHNGIALAGNHRNQHLARIIAKHGPLQFVIVRGQLSEAEAFETERALIAQFGRANIGTGSLCNMTDGGDGVAGMVMPKAARDKIGHAHRKRIGKRDLSANRAKIAAGGVVLSPATLARMSAASKGRVPSDETRAKIRAAHEGKPKTDAHRAKLAAAHLGMKATDTHKANISAANKGRKISDAQRQKMTLAMFKRHDRGYFAIRKNKQYISAP